MLVGQMGCMAAVCDPDLYALSQLLLVNPPVGFVTAREVSFVVTHRQHLGNTVCLLEYFAFVK